MILYKFFAIAFLILTPIFAFIIHRFFSLKYLGLNFADLTFPLYFIEVVAVSARFFTHSFLPYITILLSLAAIIITIQMLRKTQSFKFKRFLKLFWRISFFITSSFLFGDRDSYFYRFLKTRLTQHLYFMLSFFMSNHEKSRQSCLLNFSVLGMNLSHSTSIYIINRTGDDNILRNKR